MARNSLKTKLKVSYIFSFLNGFVAREFSKANWTVFKEKNKLNNK